MKIYTKIYTKKIVSILLTLMLLINITGISIGKPSQDAQDVTVMMGTSSHNLTEINFSQDEFPFIVNGRVMVPLRSISQPYNSILDWNGERQEVTVIVRDITLIMKIGDRDVIKIINGKATKFRVDVAPILQNGRVFVPLRLFSESFGSTVNWNSTSYVVTIIDPNIDIGLIPAPITYGGNIVVSAPDTDIKLVFKGSDAGYNNVFGIYSPIKQDLGTGHDTPNGTEFNLGKFPVGTELKFFIRNPLGNVFLNGPGTRNPDGKIHAKFQNLSPNNWYLGFEDTLDGGDGDCNDVELNIIGTVSDIPVIIPTPTPTPIPTPTPTPTPTIVPTPTPTPYPAILRMRDEQIRNGTWIDVQ